MARQLVVTWGASVNTGTHIYGDTPLHIVRYNGHMELAHLLVNAGGANINARNKIGATPLHGACIGGYHEIDGRLAC